MNLKQTAKQEIKSQLRKGIYLEKSFEIDTSNWPEKIKTFFNRLFPRSEISPEADKKGDQNEED